MVTKNSPKDIGKAKLAKLKAKHFTPEGRKERIAKALRILEFELILRKLGDGATHADLLDAYPRLTRTDIHAAIGYAADIVAHEETVLVKPRRKRSKR